MAVLWADGLGWPPTQRMVVYASQEKKSQQSARRRHSQCPERDCKMP